VTTVADTGDSRGAFDALRQSGLRGIAYREVFGPDPLKAEESLSGLRKQVETMRVDETPLVRVGVSPHTPFTVSAELFKRVTEYALAESLDVCIHAAESESERQFMLEGTGEFVDRLEERGIGWDAPGISTIKYFESLGVLGRRPLLVHCVTVNYDDIQTIATYEARVAHCPKSNAKLGHGVAPLLSMQSAGIRVGLGTDSAVSNNRCDLLSEARMAGLMHRAICKDNRSPSSSELLELATMGGARCLGLDSVIGSLEPGKQADVIAIDLSRLHNKPVNDAEASIIFSSLASDVVFTMIAGREVFAGATVSTVDEKAIVAEVDRLHRKFL
jgi:5-methylthioadenosine/S-adenosylhomocysteine deaminase